MLEKYNGNPKYEEPLTQYGDLLTVDEFRKYCKAGGFIDYDGFGHLVRNGKMDKSYFSPSMVDELPCSATHVMWYNR